MRDGPNRIADAHCHIYPDRIAGRALRQIASFYGFEDRMHEDGRVGTADYLLEQNEKCGITVTLVCEAAHRPRLVGMLNDFIAESCARAAGRFLGLGAVHPGCADIPAILGGARERGLRGIKIHPDYQEFNMDDPACDVIYSYCQREHFPILVHCGDDRYDASSPRRLQNVIDRFPELPVIAGHFGGFRDWEASFELRPGRYTYFDTSSSLFALPRGRALAFFEKFGVERFLFGTDYPLFEPAEEVRRFLALELAPAEREQILYGNFARLFGLDDPAPGKNIVRR